MFNTFLSLLLAKYIQNYTAILDPEYIITINNINRYKKRDRRKKLKNKLSHVFITEEEDNIQDAYIQENGMKLIQLANQLNYIRISRQEASILIYRAAAISNIKAIKNVKAILAYQQKNGIIDLNYQIF